MAPASNDQGSSEYGQLLSRLKEGDLSIDFQRLRFSFMESPERRAAQDVSQEKKEMLDAMSARDFKLALEAARKVLAANFVDVDAHLVAHLANHELDQAWWSGYHQNVLGRLLDSIFSHGDGKTMETAFTVISTQEEYAVLRVMGLVAGRQALVHQDGHAYDVLDALNLKSGEQVQIFFNVDIPMAHYAD